jgi:hypothetical protein
LHPYSPPGLPVAERAVPSSELREAQLVLAEASLDVQRSIRVLERVRVTTADRKDVVAALDDLDSRLAGVAAQLRRWGT